MATPPSHLAPALSRPEIGGKQRERKRCDPFYAGESQKNLLKKLWLQVVISLLLILQSTWFSTILNLLSVYTTVRLVTVFSGAA